jgi:hypothetical protein
LLGLLNAKKYDGLVIQKESKTPQTQKKIMQQDKEEDQE